MSNINKLESIDSGSNYNFGDKMIFTNAPRSKFDLSHLNTLTIPKEGEIIPIDWFETNPNEDFDINVDCLLRVMPSVVPLYSRQRLYIYAFYSRCYDLWSGWDVHAKKGYSGNVVKNRPTLNENNTYFAEGSKVKSESFADFLDLPIGSDCASLLGAGLNAMIPFMALRVWRDFFMNKNFFIDDRLLLPDDDSRFRLGDDGNVLSAHDLGKKVKFDIFGDYNDIRYITETTENDTLLFSGFFHDYPSDRFTSALPWLQRGNASSVPVTGYATIPDLPVNFDGAIFNDRDIGEFSLPLGISQLGKIGMMYNPTDFAINMRIENPTASRDMNFLRLHDNINDTDSLPVFTNERAIGSGESVRFVNLLNTLNSNVKVNSRTINLNSLEFTIEALRKALIDQSELEKMARTDGSYAQFGLTFFGERSKSARDYKPLYIGGTYKNISFTEVLQTSESANTPLGTMAGHGITGISNGRIGRFHSDDYGFVMLFACIMPDIYYSQGLDKKWTKNSQSDLYLPDRAKLGLQPIENRELFYAGNNSEEEGGDRYLWAYNNPFDEFRYSPNKVHGKIADPNSLSFFPFTQSRKFNSLKNWGRDFAEAKDIRSDYLAAPNESHYSAQFSINIRAVRPIPYKPIPAQII